MSNTGNWKLGLILSLITALMWSFLPISIIPLMDTMDPYTITFYRLSGGGVLLFLWLIVKKQKPSKPRLSPLILILLATAIISLSGNYYTWLIGLELTSPTTAQVVIQIAPMLLLFGSVVIFRESFSRKQALGVIIFISGLLLFFNQRLSGLLSDLSGYNLGVFYVVGSSIVWAIYALAQKRLLRDFHALELIFIIVIVAALLFLPFSSPAVIMDLSTMQLWLLAFGTVNTAVAYGCFTAAMHHWDTSRVSAVVAIVPVLTLGVSYLQGKFFPTFVVPESINTLSIIGAIIVVVGSSITALSKSSKEQNT